MKELFKKALAYLNFISVSLFSRVHYRRQVKENMNLLKNVHYDVKFLQESKKFWKTYGQSISVDFHRWYSSCNQIKDVRYIPEDLFYDKIERHFYKQELVLAYCDKGMYKRLFPNVNQPKTIALNMSGIFYDNNYEIITVNDILRKCEKYNEVVMKPTLDTGGGKNVTFIGSKDPIEMRRKIKANLNIFNQNFIIQEVLTQHETLQKMNPESINTIRVMSFLSGGEVTILSSVLRMGVDGARVDNGCSGGISCRINPDGTLGNKAFDRVGRVYREHPQGAVFSTEQVPGYDKVLSIIKNEHKKLPHFKIISWDFSVNQDEEPIMIELNLRWQGVNFHQLNNGPLFGDLTEKVLEEVFLDGPK